MPVNKCNALPNLFTSHIQCSCSIYLRCRTFLYVKVILVEKRIIHFVVTISVHIIWHVNIFDNLSFVLSASCLIYIVVNEKNRGGVFVEGSLIPSFNLIYKRRLI